MTAGERRAVAERLERRSREELDLLRDLYQPNVALAENRMLKRVIVALGLLDEREVDLAFARLDAVDAWRDDPAALKRAAPTLGDR